MPWSPRFWHHPPDAPGLWPRVLHPLTLLPWHRPAPWQRPYDLPTIGVHLPLANALMCNLAIVALAQAIPRNGLRPAAVLTGPDPLPDAPFLADFLPVFRRKTPTSTAQDPALSKVDILIAPLETPAPCDMSVLVIDAHQGFGNGRAFPAGPLQQPAARILAAHDLVLAVGTPPQCAQITDLALRMGWPQIAQISGQIAPLQMGMDWSGADVFAFSAGPSAHLLFAALKSQGAHLHGAVTLPSGAPPTATVLRRLRAEADKTGAQLVTTEADAQTLPPGFRKQVLAMPLRLNATTDLCRVLGGKLRP